MITRFKMNNMIKKMVCLLSVLVIGITNNDAYAIPSVKNLGGNAVVAGIKPVVATPKKQSETKVNNSRIGKATKLPTVKPVSAKTTNDSRLPAMTVGKTFNATKTIKTSVTGSTMNQPSQPVTSGVSEDMFNEAIERIDVLENKSENMINDVVETESGRYVTNVAADGNKLNVTKTNLLYLPVREGSDKTVTDEAEMWIEK